MHYDYDEILKLCDNPGCGCFIKADATVCEYCDKVQEVRVLTPEDEQITFYDLINDINKAFFRLESYMDGSIPTYYSYDFIDAFEILFVKGKQPSNLSIQNNELIQSYYDLIGEITYNADQGIYRNKRAFDNEDFENDILSLGAFHSLNAHRFCDFLNKRDIEEINKGFSVIDIVKKHPIPDNRISYTKNKPPYTLQQIALICHYSARPVTRENGNELASEFGYRSGEALYHQYTHYQSNSNLLGDEGSFIKNRNKIKALNKIIEYFKSNEKVKEKIVRDIKAIEKHMR